MIDRLLSTSVTIYSRAASTADAHGSPTTTTSSTTETVCYVEQKQQQDDYEGNQRTARAEYLLVLPAGTTIDQNDRVLIGSTTYEVRGIPWSATRAPTGVAHHVECTIVEVAG